MANIISLINHKGGVGKTTTTLNLGKALALEGKRVLIVDIDPQANLSQSVGVENPEKSIYEVLCEGAEPPIHTIGENFDLLPSELSLGTAEPNLMAEPIEGYFKLHNSLEGIEDNYDFILIDCPPSLGILTINALLASDDIIIVIEAQYLAIKGLQSIVNLYEKLNKNLNKDIGIAGIVFNRFNRTVVSKSIIEQVKNQYENLTFNTIINQSVKITEASVKRQSIFDYDPESKPAKDYNNLSQEILEIYG